MNARYQFLEDQRLTKMRKFNDSLPGRILTVLLSTLVASGLTYLIYLANRGIVPVVLQWVLIAGIGLTAGFTARFILAGRTYLLRILTVLLSLLISLLFLGLISRGLLGTHLPAPDQNGLNLNWLGQFLLAAATAWLSLSAWRISTRPTSSRTGALTARSRASQTGLKLSQLPSPNAARSARRSPQRSFRLFDRDYWQRGLKNAQSKFQTWWQHGLPDLPLESPRAKKRPSVRLQARHTRRSQLPRKATAMSAPNPAVRLIGREEHRCPYCLEIVEDKDPRGVKVCPICHTHHHADCWDVTGTCQVPHYHE